MDDNYTPIKDKKDIIKIIFTIAILIVIILLLYIYSGNYSLSDLYRNGFSKDLSINSTDDTDIKYINSTNLDRRINTNISIVNDKPNTIITNKTNLTKAIVPDLILLNQYNGSGLVNATTTYNSLINKITNNVRPTRIDNVENIINNPTDKQKRDYINFVSGVMIPMLLYKDQSLELSYYYNDKNISNIKTLHDELSKICAMSNLKGLEVPVQYVEAYKDFVYTCDFYISFLNSIINRQDDPLRAQIGLNLYEELYNSKVKMVREHSNIIKADNIHFNNKESGYIFEVPKT